MAGTQEQIARLEEYREQLAVAEQRLREFQSEEQVEARESYRARWIGRLIIREGISEGILSRARQEASTAEEDWLFEDTLLEDEGYEITSIGLRRRAGERK